MRLVSVPRYRLGMSCTLRTQSIHIQRQSYQTIIVSTHRRTALCTSFFFPCKRGLLVWVTEARKARPKPKSTDKRKEERRRQSTVELCSSLTKWDEHCIQRRTKDSTSGFSIVQHDVGTATPTWARQASLHIRLRIIAELHQASFLWLGSCTEASLSPNEDK
jgi:hypothetical protein